MEVVGYADIRKNPTTGVSHLPISEFTGQPVRVFEFADDGGVVVVNPNGNGLATFDRCDVHRSFRCQLEGDCLLPPDITDFADKYGYVFKVLNRKGGYNGLLRNMIIQASLMKGVFNDKFLFAKQ